MFGSSRRLGCLVEVSDLIIAKEILVADVGAGGTLRKLGASKFPRRESSRSIRGRAAKEDGSIAGVARSSHG